MATIDIDVGNIQEVITSNEFVLIDFWSEWCGPCRAFAPVFHETSEKHPDVVFAKCDTGANPQIAMAFGIRAIPTVVGIRSGALVISESGMMPAAALDEVVEALKRDSVPEEGE